MREAVYNYMRSHQGVTLIELIITIVILGITLASIMSILSSGFSRSADPLWQSKAVELMQAYMDEIIAMRFDGTTPLGGGAIAGPCTISSDGQARTAFDDVDDYNGLDEQPPMLISGVTLNQYYSDYRVQINVACAGTEVGLPSNDFAKRITITVTGPSSDQLQLAAYKGNF